MLMSSHMHTLWKISPLARLFYLYTLCFTSQGVVYFVGYCLKKDFRGTTGNVVNGGHQLNFVSPSFLSFSMSCIMVVVVIKWQALTLEPTRLIPLGVYHIGDGTIISLTGLSSGNDKSRVQRQDKG